MPRIRQEITVWDKSPTTPNHIYITEGTNLIGYVPHGHTTPRMFSQPMKQWSPSRRKFRDLKKSEISALNLPKTLDKIA